MEIQTLTSATVDTSVKLHVKGKVKIADGTEGTDKVLTSDANGVAAWKPSAASLAILYCSESAPAQNGTTGVRFTASSCAGTQPDEHYKCAVASITGYAGGLAKFWMVQPTAVDGPLMYWWCNGCSGTAQSDVICVKAS